MFERNEWHKWRYPPSFSNPRQQPDTDNASIQPSPPPVAVITLLSRQVCVLKQKAATSSERGGWFRGWKLRFSEESALISCGRARFQSKEEWDKGKEHEQKVENYYRSPGELVRFCYGNCARE